MRSGIIKGAILLAILLTVSVVVWVYYAQWKDDQEANAFDKKLNEIQAVDDSLAAPADTTQTQGP